MRIDVAEVSTPLGPITVLADEQTVLATGFDGKLSVPSSMLAQTSHSRTPLLEAVAEQLAEYFTGQRVVFELPLGPLGLSAFRASVGSELLHIPYGATSTYAQVALELASPGASRAVGNACARNPLPVLIPCHRVLRASGALGGYVGGGARKQALLELEGAR